MHPLLLRQLKKTGLDCQDLEPNVQDLLERVSKYYDETDNERYTMQRSFEVSSKEMQDLRANLVEEKSYLESMTSEGICIVDKSWNILSLNSEAVRILGGVDYVNQNVAFEQYVQIFKDKEGLHEIATNRIKKALTQGEQMESNRAYLKSLGKMTPVSFSLNPLTHSDEKEFRGAIFIFRDITEQLCFEEALQDALKEAQRLNETKSLFLANMSHEIRTPMNGVIGMLQLLDKSELDDRQKGYLKLSMEAADNLLKVINDILDFSKLEVGKVEFEQVEFHLHQEIDTIQALLMPQFNAKQIQFEVAIESEVPTHIKSDPLRLRQVILNLMSNALKFTPKKGTVSLGLQLDEAKQLKVSVTDTGIGIAADVQKGLFDSFFQADQSTTRIYGGTGLGLAICKSIVEKNGGEISVQSTIGKGSTFSFTFPFSGPLLLKRSELTSDTVSMTMDSASDDIRVLVADDNELNLKVTKEMLNLLGYEVSLVSDGKQAYERLIQEHFDVVLMDCHMPFMDGYEATRKVREHETLRGITASHPEYQVIIALTADAFQTGKDKCFEAGMDDYLSKPFQMDVLSELIQQYLDDRKPKSA